VLANLAANADSLLFFAATANAAPDQHADQCAHAETEQMLKKTQMVADFRSLSHSCRNGAARFYRARLEYRLLAKKTKGKNDDS
jgi:hypothetical protein